MPWGVLLLLVAIFTGVMYFKSYEQAQRRLTLRVDFWLLLTALLGVTGLLLLIS